MSPSNATPLGEARAWLRLRVTDGEHCPCCGQFAKVYRRKLNSGMARSLIAMYRKRGLGWVHLPSELPARSREEGKLAYWALVQEATEPRDDGGRAGWWRVTPRGEQFVLGHTTVAKYARIYDGRLLSLDQGERVSIHDALGDQFDYSELMSA